MKTYPEKYCPDQKLNNYVFLGEAGCGKSEISVNLAVMLAQEKQARVQFFDLDMTKPLFRSRDIEQELLDAGVEVFYEDQYMDAPTAVGGVVKSLRDPGVITVLDVGGDYIGARLIGGYAPHLRNELTGVYYIVNPYRPWSATIEHINGVLGQILTVAHMTLDDIRLVANPNLGGETSVNDILDGWKTLEEMIHRYKPFEFCTVSEQLFAETALSLPIPVFPIRRFLVYPWSPESEDVCT